jgi:hypothetical protein
MGLGEGFGFGFRVRVSDGMVMAECVGVKHECPPDPGYMSVCIRCGLGIWVKV